MNSFVKWAAFSSMSASLVLVCAGAAAADNPSLTAVASPSSGLLQVLFGLILVLAAIGATAWLLRRFVPGQAGAAGAFRIIGGAMVGPKERLVLVEINDTWLLLGVASGQVNTLHTMPRPDHPPSMDGSAKQPGFATWLKRASQGRRDG
jgi:flagellar protein FliO/FliZ